jgi:photosystem II stability/assembly factor-like uncharacterized protein
MRAYGDGIVKTAAVLGAACMAALLAACGGSSAPAAPDTTSATTGQQAAATVSSAGETVDLIDLAAPGLGLVGLGIGAQGNGSARLVISADNGRSFTAIGPATAAGTAADDVYFRNRLDGWFMAFNTSTTADTLYRTTDGGRSWRSSSAAGHDLAAGSQDSVQFVSATRGWLLSVQATGPSESLAVTADGGTTWRDVASLHPSNGEGLLPELGLVRFTSSVTGWLGGGQYSQALYRTSDAGRSWQRVALRAPAGSVYGLPADFGGTLVEPVAAGAGLALYRSTDGGARWSMMSVLPGVYANPGCSVGPGSVSLPTAQAGWVATVRGNRTVVYRSTDGGLHWTKLGTSWPVPADSCEEPVIQASDALHAWVLTVGTDRVYATSDGGSTWRRIDTAALAAARG